MDFDFSPKVVELQKKVQAFMDEHIYPNEELVRQQQVEAQPLAQPPIIEELKQKAQGARGCGTSSCPRASAAPASPTSSTRRSARSWAARGIAPEVFNCAAPDTGNMEVLERYGTAEQKKQWLEPLLDGEIRSAFAMTEPDVASSDATNIRCAIRRDGDDYVINGRKWWTSGVLHPHCKIMIVMGKTDPDAPPHQQQSHDPGAARHAGREGRAPPAGLRLRRRAARPRRGAVRGRARAGVEHPARRRPRLRDRAGPPRPGPHPPLHARHRRRRARARADVQARASRASPSASRSPSRR